MFEWEKGKIVEFNNQLEDLYTDLIDKTSKQNDLEKDPNVKLFISLLKLQEVNDYIKLKKDRAKLKDDIIKKKSNILKMEQDICPHKTLLYISDLSDENDNNRGTNHYKCMCLKCGLVAKLQFINGKRNGTFLYNIGEIDDDKLIELEKVYNELKESDMSTEEIIGSIMKNFNNKKNKRKIRNKNYNY